ncbi:MAG: hypothetical protein M3O71_10250 [Bacteroidota bacterium]|nr:hypothetical protein [Bacteroidota bacterium]
MSESEYKELILAEYDRQMAAKELRSELLLPTPANIKAEVVKFCEQDSALSTGDEKILHSFVGKKTDVAAYHKAFQIGKADPFRQVVKVLADRKVNTNIKYINLLALLIDFPSRPYHPQMKPITPSQGAATGDPQVEVGPEPVGFNVEEDPLQTKNKSYKLLWLFVPVIVIGLGWYATSKRLFHHYTGHEGCMIWNDDHYDPIECNDQSDPLPHYPIKHNLVDSFQRITNPETLTYQSVRKVWYANYKGRMEYYTHSGPNPQDTNLRVLPMTTHILEKYILHITN